MLDRKFLHYNEESAFCEATIEYDGENDQFLVTAMQQGLDLGLVIYTMADTHVLMGRENCSGAEFNRIKKFATKKGWS